MTLHQTLNIYNSLRSTIRTAVPFSHKQLVLVGAFPRKEGLFYLSKVDTSR